MPIAKGNIWGISLVKRTTDLRLLDGGGINIGPLSLLQLFHA